MTQYYTTGPGTLGSATLNVHACVNFKFGMCYQQNACEAKCSMLSAAKQPHMPSLLQMGNSICSLITVASFDLRSITVSIRLHWLPNLLELNVLDTNLTTAANSSEDLLQLVMSL